MNKNNTNTIKIKVQTHDAKGGVIVKPGYSIKKTSSSLGNENSHLSKSSINTTTNLKHPINHNKRHSPKTTHIFMRAVVEKPSLSFKRRLIINQSTDNLVTNTVSTETISINTDASLQLKRSKHASRIKKSEHISHFVAPKDNRTSKPIHRVTESINTTEHSTVVPKSQSEFLIERALLRANAHKQPSAILKQPKWHRIGIYSIPVIVVILLIIGVANFTNLQLWVASAKAGFNTSLPSYHPAGYNLGQLNYNTGIFASEFQNKSGAQNYTITQRTTTWDDKGLLNNYVTNAASYQVVKIGNRTIYLYDNGNATWIHDGIWYQINSDGTLNESQLINVANSL